MGYILRQNQCPCEIFLVACMLGFGYKRKHKSKMRFLPTRGKMGRAKRAPASERSEPRPCIPPRTQKTKGLDRLSGAHRGIPGRAKRATYPQVIHRAPIIPQKFIFVKKIFKKNLTFFLDKSSILW